MKLQRVNSATGAVDFVEVTDASDRAIRSMSQFNEMSAATVWERLTQGRTMGYVVGESLMVYRRA